MGRSDQSSSAFFLMFSQIIDEAMEGFETLGHVKGSLEKIENYILLMTVLLYITVAIIAMTSLIYLIIKLLNNRRSPPMSLIGHENAPSLAGSQQILYAVNPKPSSYSYNQLRGSPGPSKPHTIVQIPPPPCSTSAKSLQNIPMTSSAIMTNSSQQPSPHDRIITEADEEEMCILTSMGSSMDKDSLRMLVGQDRDPRDRDRESSIEQQHTASAMTHQPTAPSTSSAGLVTTKSTRFQVNEEIV